MEHDPELIAKILSFSVLFSTIYIMSLWRIYRKANQPGWAAIVPFYNIIIWLRIISKPSWWLVLLFIPLVNVVIIIWMTNLLAAKFGRDTGFTIGLIFLGILFYPLLAFKDYEYKGDSESPSTFVDDFEEKRDKLLIWAMGIFCFNALFWFVFTSFIKRWYDYYYVHIPVGIILLFPFFLVSISVKDKYRTASITLSISIMFIYYINNILPYLRDFAQNM